MRADDFKAGDVGIIVGAFDEPRTNIIFDNFAVVEVTQSNLGLDGGGGVMYTDEHGNRIVGEHG
jgi:hypothetical protein